MPRPELASPPNAGDVNGQFISTKLQESAEGKHANRSPLAWLQDTFSSPQAGSHSPSMVSRLLRPVRSRLNFGQPHVDGERSTALLSLASRF